MPDTFMLIYPRPECGGSGVLRVRPKCYARLVDLKRQTRLPIGVIVEQCVDFALDRLQLVEEGEPDAE